MQGRWGGRQLGGGGPQGAEAGEEAASRQRSPPRGRRQVGARLPAALLPSFPKEVGHLGFHLALVGS